MDFFYFYTAEFFFILLPGGVGGSYQNSDIATGSSMNWGPSDKENSRLTKFFEKACEQWN